MSTAVYGLELTTPLRISRSTMARRDAVLVELEHDGLVGRGEVVTSVYYGLDVPAILAALGSAEPRLTGDPADLAGLGLPPGVAAALDSALHDLRAQRRGLPLHALVGAPDWADVPTAYTIGITAPADAARQAGALAARGFRVLKVKLGSPDDLAVVAAVRAAAPDARLVIDPNGAWTPEDTVRALERMPWVDAVEQPVAPGRVERLAWVSARTPVPVIADEDAATAADVRALAGAVSGVNVKLAKCGGVSAARDIIQAAGDAGLDVMLGCLVASSLGIAPAVHLTAHARWVDLDGHLLLTRDPWAGIGGEDGTLRVSGAPGLGVTRR
ncbi:enolase C-terminal domain-like protein [Actinokineospora fastidiosa]|uniref:Dipeptide epimerase n=1 Tax=Actinokineospora fastidiosa TaxID=1816 RepID=A0A918GGW2_9PSEU|nr:enolase C-terminal domain-like protein [Actinokineospora fastidiosa]GGS35465.1 dipeptide epimerase [Actinokineospora fastidiosa]